MKKTHYLFTYKTPGLTGSKTRWFYSLRPVNDPKNSVADSRFMSRAGRNSAVKGILKKYGKTKVEIIQSTPAAWLKNRKK